MSINDDMQVMDVTSCPMHALRAERPALVAEDELIFPHHKRVVAQYTTDASGGRELHLYYGEKELCFDEPELFAFGEGLARCERFVARDATAWGNGYAWPRVRELLEQLLDEGILRRVDAHTSEAVSTPHGPRHSPLPPAETTVPRTWRECEAITRKLTGHPLELGYLEAMCRSIGLPIALLMRRDARSARPMCSPNRSVWISQPNGGPARTRAAVFTRSCP